jgi:hypothetical protein
MPKAPRIRYAPASALILQMRSGLKTDHQSASTLGLRIGDQPYGLLKTTRHLIFFYSTIEQGVSTRRFHTEELFVRQTLGD